MSEPTTATTTTTESGGGSSRAAGAPGIASSDTFAPRPSRRTIAMRTFLPIQLWRFLAINLRMARIIFKSHD